MGPMASDHASWGAGDRAQNAYANRSKRNTDRKDSGRRAFTPGCVTAWGDDVHRKRESPWVPASGPSSAGSQRSACC
jgi:hypothetical protein